MDGGHRGFEVIELLLLFVVKLALTTGLSGSSWLLRSLFAIEPSLAAGNSHGDYDCPVSYDIRVTTRWWGCNFMHKQLSQGQYLQMRCKL